MVFEYEPSSRQAGVSPTQLYLCWRVFCFVFRLLEILRSWGCRKGDKLGWSYVTWAFSERPDQKRFWNCGILQNTVELDLKWLFKPFGDYINTGRTCRFDVFLLLYNARIQRDAWIPCGVTWFCFRIVMILNSIVTEDTYGKEIMVGMWHETNSILFFTLIKNIRVAISY